MANELEHYGIKGMHWGVRRTPEQLGHKNLRKAKTANFDKWGKSPDTNVCYVGGYSGSGKSTLAKSIADKNTDVIHLDLYYESASSSEGRSKEFDRYLKTNKIKAPNQLSRKEWADNRTLDKFEKAVENFGKAQYSKKRKVIAEGVQILDDGFQQDKTYFRGKPVVLTGTNAIVSIQRAFERDGRGNLLKGLKNLDSASEYLQWYASMNKQSNAIANTVQAKRGSKAVKDYLKKYGNHKI